MEDISPKGPAPEFLEYLPSQELWEGEMELGVCWRILGKEATPFISSIADFHMLQSLDPKKSCLYE